MNITRKDATVTSVPDDGNGPGEFHVILSAQTLDRDGDILKSEDWDLPLPDHITFDMDHGMSVASLVGSGVPFINKDTGNLEVKGTFAGTAEGQKVRQLVNEGHCRTTSVAFMSKKIAKSNGDGTRVVRELLNGAFVAIPSNREAMVLSSKSGARNSKVDMESIQAIHDKAAGLGADCGAAKSYRGDVIEKALQGSLELIQERAREALQDANPGAYVWLRGTIPDGDGGGVLVFCVEDSETFDVDTFKQTYTDDGTAFTLTGDPSPVSVQEVIGAPDPDENEGEPGSTGTTSTDAPGAAKAVSPGSGSEAALTPEESDELEATKMRIRAYQRLANI